MPRLVVITHEFDAFASRPAPGQPATGIYLLFDVLEALESMGYETFVSAGLDPPEGDVALMHVDCTRIPQPYLDLSERFALTLNAGTADISKRRVSRILVSPGDGWRGPVIVKSDINCGGEPELRRNAHARAAGRPEPFPGLGAPAPYAVLDGVDAVPDHVWADETLVVERFRHAHLGVPAQELIGARLVWRGCVGQAHRRILYAAKPVREPSRLQSGP